MDFTNIAILVIGDLMLDEYIVGNDFRMSYEAPVPVLTVDKFEIRLGGAANVANNIKALGAVPLLSGVIGEEGTGDFRRGYSATRFMKLINEAGITDDLIIRSDHTTTTKTRVLINGHQVARYDYEQKNISSCSKSRLLETLKTIDCTNIPFVVISDYNKGVICEDILNLLRSKNIPIVIDPIPAHLELYHNIFCITPNIREFMEMSGLSKKYSSQDLLISSRHFITKNEIQNLIITMGENGSFFCDKNNFEFVEGGKKEVINIVGAGDTFVSTLALALASNKEMIEAVRLANLAASIVVSKNFTSVCNIKEIT